MLVKVLIGIALTLLLLFAGYYLYLRYVTNPQVIEELRTQPNGPRAERVLLITLPDGKELPVNYLREQEMVYIGVDGLWWRQFEGERRPVTLLIKGETLTGRAQAVLDDPVYTAGVFARLRPTAPKWLPGRMGGVLVEIILDEGP